MTTLAKALITLATFGVDLHLRQTLSSPIPRKKVIPKKGNSKMEVFVAPAK